MAIDRHISSYLNFVVSKLSIVPTRLTLLVFISISRYVFCDITKRYFLARQLQSSIHTWKMLKISHLIELKQSVIHCESGQPWFYITEGTLRTVGSYSMADKTRNINDSMIFWHGHGVPKDRIQRQDEIQKPNIYIQTALITLAVLGQFIAIAFLAVNIKYRKTRSVCITEYMSSTSSYNSELLSCQSYLIKVIDTT